MLGSPDWWLLHLQSLWWGWGEERTRNKSAHRGTCKQVHYHCTNKLYLHNSIKSISITIFVIVISWYFKAAASTPECLGCWGPRIVRDKVGELHSLKPSHQPMILSFTRKGLHDAADWEFRLNLSRSCSSSSSLWFHLSSPRRMSRQMPPDLYSLRVLRDYGWVMSPPL